MKRLVCIVALIAVSFAAPAQGQIDPITWGGGSSSASGDLTPTAIDLTQTLGLELTTQTCAGWGLAAPVGAWSCAGDTITRTASAADLAITSIAPSIGPTYKVTVVTATVTAGSLTVSMGGTTGTAITTATTTTGYFTASSTAALTLTASATFAGTITISTTGAKQVTSTIDTDVGPTVIESAGDIVLSPDSAGFIRMFRPLLFSADNTIDIGAAGATRPRTGYFGTSVFLGATENFYAISDGVTGLRSDGTSAAELRVYGDGTTGAKYIKLGHDGTNGTVDSNSGELILDGETAIRFRFGGSNKWAITSTAFIPTAANVFDIGLAGGGARTGYIYTSLQGGGSKTLTDNVATGFVKIAVASGSSVGARIRYTIKVVDAAAEQQIEEGTVEIAAINKGGTITAATPVVTATTPLVTAGTLAATTFTVAEVDADTITVSATSDTSLTATTHVIQYFVEMNAANTVTQL